MKYLLTNKKHLALTLFIVFGVVLVLAIPQISLAAEGQPVQPEEAGLMLKVLWKFVNAVFGSMVFLAGMLLDYTVTHYVVGFGFFYASNGIGSAIDILWTSVRDIFNLTFIFGLVYIGFKMILNSSDSSAKKALGTLIMAALLVNFSLFITKSVIDFSNIAATQFIQEFKVKDPPNSNEYNISDTLMGHLGVQTIFWAEQPNELSWGYLFGTMYLYLISAFVFAAGGILLLIRLIALCIYMLLSPAMFIGWVFPGFDSVSKQYWKGFLGQAFFAPAYFLMIYFSMEIIKKLKVGLNITGNESGGQIGAAFNGMNYTHAADSFNGILMFFLLASGFMIASLVVAKKMGAVGADKAVSLGNMAAGKVRGSVTSSIGRNTIGRTAGVADYANKKLERTKTGRNFKRILSVASLGTLNERGRRAAIDAGKKAKFGGSYSRQDDKDWKSKREEGIYTMQSEHEDNQKIKAGQAGAEDLAALRAKQKAGTTLIPVELTQLQKLEQTEAAMIAVVASMAHSQLEKMSTKDLEKIAPHLTNSQVENIMKSDKIDPAAKAATMKARQDAIKKIIGTGSGVITEELTKLSIEQIETMGDEWIRENAHLFSNTQMEDLKKSKKFVESQKNNYVAQRSGWHKAAMAPGGPASFNGKATDPSQIFKHTNSGKARKAEDVANLGRDILVGGGMTPAFLNANPTFLTKDALEIISTKKTLGTKDREDLEALIIDAYTMPGGNVALKPLVDYLNSPRVLKNGGF